MKKASFGIVALLGFGLAVPAMAQAPEEKGPAAPAKAAPGSAKAKQGADKPGGAAKAEAKSKAEGKPGAPGMGKHPGMPGYHGGMSPEQLRELAEKRQAQMAERSKDLREKAAKARASGDTKQAEQLEKAAERFENKGAPPGLAKRPKAGPAWEKQKKARKVAQLKPLWKKYGERLKKQPVRAEFTKHAQRIARLQRMRELAANNPNEDAREKLLERIDGLLTKEKSRHQEALQEALEERKDQVAKAKAEKGEGKVETATDKVNPAAAEKAAPAAPQEAK